jgi:alpha-galactosidase
MSTIKLSRRGLLGASAALGALPAAAATKPPAKKKPLLAPTPPMGWNSWNSFATTITEAQTLEQAGIMARELLPAGYDILTVDIQWYEPGASSYEYAAKPIPTLDANGRPRTASRPASAARASSHWPTAAGPWVCASAST